MILKIYKTLWAIIAALAAVIWLAGFMTPMTLVAFGFVLFGMIFMGMISVLPSTVHEQPAQPKAKPIVKQQVKEGYVSPNSAIAH